MSEPNHLATLARVQEQIAMIAGAQSLSAVDLLNLWARGYVEAFLPVSAYIAYRVALQKADTNEQCILRKAHFQSWLPVPLI